jgi:bacillithiol biosynthesis deacetylase BshB1
MAESTTIDALAIGAHPDDADFAAGGTLLHLRSLGYTTGILDMSRGEMGTRGTPEERAQEATDAARALGLEFRETLDLGDGSIRDTDRSRAALVDVFRRLRPKLILTHHWDEAHPDHVATSHLVRACAYLSGLGKYNVNDSLERHRPCAIAHFNFPRWVQPTFVIDITAWAEQKSVAARCHRSQLFDPNRAEPETALSGEDFLDKIDARARYFGGLVGVRLAEAFFVKEALNVEDPIRLLNKPMNLFY